MSNDDDGKELHSGNADEKDTCLRGDANGDKKVQLKLEDDEEHGSPNNIRKRPSSFVEHMRSATSRRPRQIMLMLLLLVLVLFVAVVVLAVWPSCPDAPILSRRICTDTPECLKASANLISLSNSSIDPCSDFYEFACGGRYSSGSWSSTSQFTMSDYDNSRGTIGVLTDARHEFMRRSREIIDTLEYASDFRSPRWQVKAFYQSCMDLDGVDSAGDVTLKRHIEQLKGWKPIGTWQLNVWDWSKVLRDLQSLHGVFPFFKVDVVPFEALPPNRNVIQISPSGLGLPHYSYYFRNPSDKVIQSYRRLMTDLATLLGATGDRAIAFADEAFHFEKRIAELRAGFITEHGDRRSGEFNTATATPSKTEITIAELRQISQRINWIDHLKAILPQVYISEDTLLYVTDKRYLTDVSTILSTTDMGSLNSYLIWTLVLHYAPSLSKPYRNAADMYNRVYTGAIASRPRWEFCIESTYAVFSLAITSFYVKSDSSSQSFYLAFDLYRDVKSSFIETLKRNNLITSSIIDKTKNIKNKISYRDFALDDSELDAYYDQMSVLKTDFLQNIQNGALFRRSQLEKAISKQSFEYLDLDMLTRDDIYDGVMKGIVLSPFLLQKTLFDVSRPRYLLYGSLGSRFGHGLVRGFQDIGKSNSQVGPKFGSNKTETEFTKYRRCISDNFSERFKFDGNRTVESDVADITGLTQAYKAFLEFENREGKEPLIPGTSLTAEQLFFVSYAQTMCSASRPEQLENDLNLASHPPDKFSLLGTLSQISQFADVFQCPRGTPYNPSSRCVFW